MSDEDKPKQISSAPPPITPIRGSTYTPSRTSKTANWEMWKYIPKCELWQAICLTLDIEPEGKDLDFDTWRQARHSVRSTWLGSQTARFPEEFGQRLRIAQANLNLNGPIRPLELYSGVMDNPQAEVLLPEIAAFAIRCGWPIPEVMQAMAQPREMSTSIAPAPEKEELQSASNSAGVGQAGLKKREQQIKVIEEIAKIQGYDPMRIPDGGKTLLMKLCKYAKPDIFGAGNDPFDEAWKEGIKQGRVRMENHSKYSSKR